MTMGFSTGRLARVVLTRVPPGVDIIERIEAVCQGLDIRCGAITCCIGSLRRAAFMVAIPMNNRAGAGYSEPKFLDGPLELLSGQGSIGQEEGGGLFVHLHGLLSDRDGRIYGGHLVRGENPVLITCEIMIGHVEGIQMLRTHDPEVDMKVLMPS